MSEAPFRLIRKESSRRVNTSPAVARERARQARHFVEWLAQYFPSVRTWERLSRAMVQTYAAGLEQRGLASDQFGSGSPSPVQLGWRLMNQEFPELIRPEPNISASTPPDSVWISGKFRQHLSVARTRSTTYA